MSFPMVTSHVSPIYSNSHVSLTLMTQKTCVFPVLLQHLIDSCMLSLLWPMFRFYHYLSNNTAKVYKAVWAVKCGQKFTNPLKPTLWPCAMNTFQVEATPYLSTTTQVSQLIDAGNPSIHWLKMNQAILTHFKHHARRVKSCWFLWKIISECSLSK